MISEPVITTIENITIIKDLSQDENGEHFMRCRVIYKKPDTDKEVVLSDLKLAITTELDDFTPTKALIATWLGLGLFVPLTARTEVLSDYGLSKTGFQVTPYAIEVAHAYNVLTEGKDITEAI